MKTLLENEPKFQTNANQTGLQTFEMILNGSTVDGKNVYVYQRTKDDAVFGYEVVIPKIVKAGTYTFPGGVTRTYDVDTEEYPNGAKTDFGKRAWFCNSLERAKERFNTLTKTAIQLEDEQNEKESEAEIESHSAGRGRPKVDRPVLTMPSVEFSVKELAEQNKTDYSVAFLFLKDMEALNKVQRTRTERRAAKGKPTQLFKAVNS